MIFSYLKNDSWHSLNLYHVYAIYIYNYTYIYIYVYIYVYIYIYTYMIIHSSNSINVTSSCGEVDPPDVQGRVAILKVHAKAWSRAIMSSIMIWVWVNTY